MQRLQAYRLLSTRSRRAIKRKYDNDGRPYEYRPRARLLVRIADQLGITTEQAQDELFKDRDFLLNLDT
jgi:hypothetical protein